MIRLPVISTAYWAIGQLCLTYCDKMNTLIDLRLLVIKRGFMKKLRKHLLNLALGELAAAFSFLVVSKLYIDLGFASLLALSFLVLQLIQGVLYWVFRSQSLGKEKSLLMRKTLIVLRRTNLLLSVLVVILLIMLAQNKRDLFLGMLIYVFSVIEYINYYWYRLSYGKSGFNIKLLIQAGLKPSSIHKLLKRK